jgi:hypothetical protein
MDLRLGTAMPNRSQQLGIDSRQPRQCPRIVSIIFSIALGDQFHFLCVCHGALDPHVPVTHVSAFVEK